MAPRSLDRLAARAGYAAGTLAGRYPRLALPIARRRGHGSVAGPETTIVIEGYPRSGNYFAVAAFQVAQPRPVPIAHHTHAPANVIAGLRLGVPVLVLVRDPEEAVVELVGIKPFLSVPLALRGYLRFYEPLLRLGDRSVAGSFEGVTADFGSVIRQVNERFGVHFSEFEHTKENLEAVEVESARLAGSRTGPGLPLMRTERPPEAAEASGTRDSLDALHRAYRSSSLAGLRRRARRVHDLLVGTVVESSR